MSRTLWKRKPSCEFTVSDGLCVVVPVQICTAVYIRVHSYTLVYLNYLHTFARNSDGHGRRMDKTEVKMVSPELLADVDTAVLRALFTTGNEMLAVVGGEEGLKIMRDKCVSDHSKEGAREELQKMWAEFMRTYIPPPIKKCGRKTTLKGHGSSKLMSAAPAADGGGAACHSAALANMGMHD